MRLIAVPLARATRAAAAASAPSSSRLAPPICTYIVQRPPPPTASSDASSSPSKLPLTTRLLNKASDFWIGLGKDGTEPGKKAALFNWKRRTYAAGEKLMDRIEYQEWALKGIDPALGPSLKPRPVEDGDAKEGVQVTQGRRPPQTTTLPLLYPSTLIHPPSILLTSLTHLTTTRTPHHRTRLLYCVAGMPLTIPFALVPIVPNLPFFYLVWRAWSHWKAWKASEYMGTLLREGRVELMPSEEVEGAFDVVEGGESSSSGSSGGGGGEGVEVLLTPSRIDELARRLKLEEQPVLELRRALQQTRMADERGELRKVIEEEERVAAGAETQGASKSADGEEETRKDR